MSPEEIELPVGETGELWIKGPNVFQGYLNNVESTRHALTKDGYFKTGDVGYQDTEGNLFITDRAKELIKYKGFQVAPAELEGLLLACPDVQDAAVIGVDKPERGTEVPMAFIVLARGVKGTEEKAKEIHEWVNERVSYYKKLRGGIRWVDSVPRSPSGKILRKSLRAKYHGKDRSSKL
jgi:acyl-CoA synthetase (AMP-forming)/AMP-acid ligase II